jgi:hypothetical protein
MPGHVPVDRSDDWAAGTDAFAASAPAERRSNGSTTWLTAAVAVLYLAGVALPGVTSGVDSMTWQYLAVGVVLVLAAIDAGRRNLLGPGVAVGVCAAMVGTLQPVVRLVTGASDESFRLGTVAWIAAIVCGVVLFLQIRREPDATDRLVHASKNVGIAIGVAAAIWCIAMVVPDPRIRVGSGGYFPYQDNVRKIFEVLRVLVALAAFGFAAARRTRLTIGIALGVAVVQTTRWATDMQLRGDVFTIASVPALFELATLGTFAIAIALIVAAFTVAAPSTPVGIESDSSTGEGGLQRRAAGVVFAAIAAILVLMISGLSARF